MAGTALTVSGTPPLAVVGQAFTFTPTISGGTTPYTVSAAPDLPAGYTLNATTGAITAKAVPAGLVNTTLSIKDSTPGGAVTQTLSVSFTPVPELTISDKKVSGEVGVPLTLPLTTTGGQGSKTFALASGGTLPAGLSLNPSTGVITGTPTKAASTSATISVTDKTGAPSATVTFTIVAAVALGGTAPSGNLIDAYKLTPTVTGGVAPYTWSSSTLPSGIVQSQNDGSVSGQFTQTGDYTITLSVTDALGASASHDYTFTIIESKPLITEIPSAIQNTQYTATIEGATAVSGTLPKGLVFKDGVISGVPTEHGDFILTLTVGTQSLLGVLTVGGSTFTPPGASLHPLDQRLNDEIDRLNNYIAVGIADKTNIILLANQLNLVTNLLLRAPTLLALTLVWNLHVSQKDGIFVPATLAQIVAASTDPRTAQKTSVVHTAFYNTLSAPTSVFGYDDVVRIGRSTALVSFLEEKLGRLVG